MQYQIMFTNKALKSLRKLPEQTRKQINKKLTTLSKDPFDKKNDVKKLQGVDEGYRLRSGDYRVVYTIDGKALVVTVVRIAHRKEVYR